MKDQHRDLRPRKLTTPRRIKRCPQCQWQGRNLTEHLIEKHHTPLVRLWQGDYERRIG